MRKTHVMFFWLALLVFSPTIMGIMGLCGWFVSRNGVFCATCETPYDDISSITKEGYKGI